MKISSHYRRVHLPKSMIKKSLGQSRAQAAAKNSLSYILSWEINPRLAPLAACHHTLDLHYGISFK